MISAVYSIILAYFFVGLVKMTELVLSCLPKTWLIDIDGVILKHNGYKQDGEILLPGVKKFWHQISKEDFVVLLTAML